MILNYYIMDEHFYLWAQWGIVDYKQHQAVLRHFGDLKTAWQKIDAEFLARLGFRADKVTRIMECREKMDFGDLSNQMDKLGIRIIGINDPEYPMPLKDIPNPPPFLFIRGKWPSFHKAIGIVGTRTMTDYGKMATEKIARGLVHNGFVVVSGLAMGVDAQAHETTLDQDGVTVGVLGCGVDRPYPLENFALAERIIESGGAIVSEYPLGTPAMPHHFPERNRIISGLSRGIVVIEGGIKSGALITARYALEHGREVFAVPTDIIRHALSGTNHLIRKGEAKLIERVEDILSEFRLEPTANPKTLAFTSLEAQILEYLMTEGKTIDDLVLETTYNVAKLSEILIGLQLKGVVREIGGKWMML